MYVIVYKIRARSKWSAWSEVFSDRKSAEKYMKEDLNMYFAAFVAYVEKP